MIRKLRRKKSSGWADLHWSQRHQRYIQWRKKYGKVDRRAAKAMG